MTTHHLKPGEHAPKVRELIEVQDRQYDPGYWIGGNIHPLLRGRRPNRYGYVLYWSAVLGFAAVIGGVSEGRWSFVVMGGLAALLFGRAGWKLLHPRPHAPRD